MDFEANPHSLETKGGQPQESTAVPQHKQMTAPQPATITAAEQFALLTQKPTAASEPSAAASQAQSRYRRMKNRSRISGNITSRGISAVNALGTPLGRYQKIVADLNRARWDVVMGQKPDLITIAPPRGPFCFLLNRPREVPQNN